MRWLPRGSQQWVRVVLLWGSTALAVGLGGVYMIRMPGYSYAGPLPPLSPEEVEVQAWLHRHVRMFAGKIGERNLWRYAALEAAARYIEETLQGMGYEVRTQSFEVAGKTVKNLEAVLVGSTRAEEIVLIGAHYDSVLDSPGANDNATGVAAVLEIARLLAKRRLARTVRFVAFVNEEPPFFQTDAMGSRVYARRARAQGEQISAMLCLETIGYYTDAAGSQRYPFPFRYFYPTVANFLGFVGNLASRSLVHRSIASFRQHATVPSEGVAAPGWLTGIGWSDHGSFWQEGYAAMMVTDTALFRYAPYHTQDDTPEKIDYGRTARVVTGLASVVADLAENSTP
ncbi:Bacterial leucyl aminopeptidase [Candidatus Entotheonellaceae bacterium PAL068K]